MNHTEVFLNDPKFYQWVKAPNKELDDYWQAWSLQNPDKIKDLQEARAFLNAIHFKQYTANEAMKNTDWEIIRKGTQNESILFRIFSPIYRSAAVITLLLASIILAYLIYDNKHSEIEQIVSFEQKQTLEGQKVSIKLTDGTYIKLNSGSKLIYPTQFSESVRKVKLIGEAYFEVAKDSQRPFLVESGNVTTKVLGTKFNINGYNSHVEVSLIEGSVEVSSNMNGKTTRKMIVPGEKASWNNNQFTIEKLSKLEDIAWKDNILYFYKSSILEIKDVLEKWYGVSIQVSEPNKIMESFNGEFQDESLANILQSMGFAMKFNYRIENKNVYIKPNENE